MKEYNKKENISNFEIKLDKNDLNQGIKGLLVEIRMSVIKVSLPIQII